MGNSPLTKINITKKLKHNKITAALIALRKKKDVLADMIVFHIE